MSRLAAVLSVIAAVLSLAAFGLLACYLSSLYPLFPELLCYPQYSRVFEALLAGALALYIASLVVLSRRARPVSRSFTLLAGAAAGAALALLVDVLRLVRGLSEVRFDSGCERGMGSLMLQVFTLPYVGPMLSALLAVLATVVAYRAHRRQAF